MIDFTPLENLQGKDSGSRRREILELNLHRPSEIHLTPEAK
jgi:hypothetical protein